MREATRRRVPVLARVAVGLPTALGTIAAFPAAACALTLLLSDPRPHPDRAGH